MGKKLISIIVKGKEKEWGFSFYGDPEDLQEWREDGLQVDLVENTIPDNLPIGLTKLWCFFQDLFNFNNPFKS